MKYLITIDRKASTYQKIKEAYDMDFGDRWHNARVGKRTGKHTQILNADADPFTSRNLSHQLGPFHLSPP
jgi:hypothetical protein